MLDETLIVWGGEFGRTPMAQGNGRDHHIKGFSMFVAGGGIQGGITHGSTDDLGYNAVEDICPVHDLHATMLHLMGVDHKRLTYEIPGAGFPFDGCVWECGEQDSGVGSALADAGDCSGSLSPVLGGEGWGEGPFSRVAQPCRTAPHPNTTARLTLVGSNVAA
jgi:hypothetical protein